MARTRAFARMARRFRREGRRASPVHPPGSPLGVYEDVLQSLGALDTANAGADDCEPHEYMLRSLWEDGVAWVPVYCGGDAQRLLEYLVLVDLLARVDPGAFVDLVVGLFGDDGRMILALTEYGANGNNDDDDDDRHQGHCRRILGYQLQFPSGSNLRALGHVLDRPWGIGESFATFRRVRDELLSLQSDTGLMDQDQAFIKRPQIPMKIVINASGPSDDIVMGLADFLGLQQNGAATRPDDQKALFDVRSCSLGPSSMSPPSWFWELFVEIARTGIVLDQLGTGVFERLRLNPEADVRPIQRLLRCRSLSSVGTDGIDVVHSAMPNVRSVVLRADVDVEELVAACSAVIESQTVQSIHIRWEQDEAARQAALDRGRAQCLATVLFGNFRGQALEAVSVPGSMLSPVFIDALRETLVASRENEDQVVKGSPRFPFTILGPAGRNPDVLAASRTSTWVKIQPEARIYTKDPCTTQINDANVAMDDDFFQIGELPCAFTTQVLVDDGSEWLQVAVPGFGAAVVHREDTQPCPHTSLVVCERNLKHLIIREVTYEDLDGVLSFIRLVGSTVRRLELRGGAFGDENCLSEDLLRELLVSCPQLDELHFMAISLQGVRSLTAIYSERRCHITRLSFGKSTKVADLESIHDFFDALGDPWHPMSRRLRALSFDIKEDRSAEISCPRGSIMDGCCRMLVRNSSLVFLSATTRESPDPLQYRKVFDARNRGLVSVRKHGLPLAVKLAFLAVLTRYRDSRQQLPRDASRLIFEFGAECARRWVDLFHY